MHQEYTAVIKKDAGGWIGWIEQIPAGNCQGAMRAERIESPRITLRETLDELNRYKRKRACRRLTTRDRYPAPSQVLSRLPSEGLQKAGASPSSSWSAASSSIP